MYVEQLRWLPAIPCSKPIHLPPTHFAFLEEGVFLAKMIKKKIGIHKFHLLALIFGGVLAFAKLNRQLAKGKAMNTFTK
ncbi:hypothetical protein TU52_23665 [Bacillus cereus]|nr:hypothetical protein TU52_23665 [Bacillus cereus]